MQLALSPSPGSLRTALARAERSTFTYPDVGATAGATWPCGQHVAAATGAVGHGVATFHRAADALLSWGLQRAAGLAVAASAERAAPGVTVVSATPGPLSLLVPCRVVHLVDEPTRVGFAYGTLPGHPLAGEEVFSVQLHDDGAVVVALASFSRCAGPARLAPPLARAGQHLMNRRYAAAGRRLLAPADPAP